MATKSTFRCPLCLKTFNQPKLLEQCMHSFCRVCICAYVKTFISTDQRENRISCPICKTKCPGPGSVILIEEWSEHLPSDILLLKLLGSNSGDNYCEPCNVRGKHTQASKACKECQERLCGHCSELHSSFKGTRTHSLIDIGRYSGSGNNDIQPPRCEYHKQKKMEYYCKDHDELICSKCAVLLHRICGILELGTTSEHLLQKISVTNIRSNFQTLKTDIETANKTAEKENDSFQDQVRKALSDVEDKRKKINASFDRYKTKIADATKTQLEHETAVKTEDKKISTGIDNSLILLDTAIKSGNNIQLFLRCRAMKRQVDGCRKHINDCKSRCKSTQLDYSISAYVTALINDCSAIGTFQMSAAKSDSISSFKIGRSENQMTNVPVVSPSCIEQTEYFDDDIVDPTVERDQFFASKDKPRDKIKVDVWGLTIDPKLRPNVCVKTTRTVEIVLPDGSKPFFGGVAYLNDDRVVMTDVKYHRLILLDRDLNFLSELKVERRPRKVTVVNKNQVAVGLSNARKVLIVNIGEKMVTSKCIYTNHLSKCVLGNNQRLFLTSYDGRLEDESILTCYNLQNDEETIIESIQGMYDACHIAMMNRDNRSYILHSCRNDETIKCHTEDGKEVFSYKLLGPGGIDVDKYGNIFVASLVRHKIIHLSPTGSLIKTLVTGNLYKPFEVRMNTARDKILVTQFESSEIHLIGLSYQ